MFTIQARDRGLGIGGNGRMSAESGYVHDGGRMEVGHRLEVAGALLVWRRESTYLAGESGKGRGGAMYMLGARGLLRGGRCWNVVPGAGAGGTWRTGGRQVVQFGWSTGSRKDIVRAKLAAERGVAQCI